MSLKLLLIEGLSKRDRVTYKNEQIAILLFFLKLLALNALTQGIIRLNLGNNKNYFLNLQYQSLPK